MTRAIVTVLALMLLAPTGVTAQSDSTRPAMPELGSPEVAFDDLAVHVLPMQDVVVDRDTCATEAAILPRDGWRQLAVPLLAVNTSAEEMRGPVSPSLFASLTTTDGFTYPPADQPNEAFVVSSVDQFLDGLGTPCVDAGAEMRHSAALAVGSVPPGGHQPLVFVFEIPETATPSDITIARYSPPEPGEPSWSVPLRIDGPQSSGLISRPGPTTGSLGHPIEVSEAVSFSMGTPELSWHCLPGIRGEWYLTFPVSIENTGGYDEQLTLGFEVFSAAGSVGIAEPVDTPMVPPGRSIDTEMEFSAVQGECNDFYHDHHALLDVYGPPWTILVHAESEETEGWHVLDIGTPAMRQTRGEPITTSGKASGRSRPFRLQGGDYEVSVEWGKRCTGLLGTELTLEYDGFIGWGVYLPTGGLLFNLPPGDYWWSTDFLGPKCTWEVTMSPYNYER